MKPDKPDGKLLLHASHAAVKRFSILRLLEIALVVQPEPDEAVPDVLEPEL